MRIQVGLSVAAQVERHTEQVTRIGQAVDDADDHVTRASAVIRRALVRMVADRLVLCMIVLIAMVLGAVIMLRIFGSSGPERESDQL